MLAATITATTQVQAALAQMTGERGPPATLIRAARVDDDRVHPRHIYPVQKSWGVSKLQSVRSPA